MLAVSSSGTDAAASSRHLSPELPMEMCLTSAEQSGLEGQLMHTACPSGCSSTSHLLLSVHCSLFASSLLLLASSLIQGKAALRFPRCTASPHPLLLSVSGSL